MREPIPPEPLTVERVLALPDADATEVVTRHRIAENLYEISLAIYRREFNDDRIARLIATIDRKAWRDPQIICPAVWHPLTPDELAEFRALAVMALEAREGEFVLDRVRFTVEDGEIRRQMA